MRNVVGLHRAGRVLLYMPYERANALRRRLATAARRKTHRVSRLYRAGDGWAMTVCTQCATASSGRRLTERRMQPA